MLPHREPNRSTRSPARSWRPRPIAQARLLAFCLGLGAVGGAQAQTLQTLYEAARGYDATYLAARSLAESAQYKAAQADALLRPSANLSSTLGHTYADLPVGPNRSSTSLGAGISGKQPLFNRANAVTIDQAGRALEVSRADLESAEQDLIVRLAQAYFDVLSAQDTLATTRTSKAAISEQLASAKRNFEVGTATITDTREAQARFDLATAQEIAAENDLRTKRIALDQLVGRNDVKPAQLLTPVALPALAPASVEAWVSASDSEHPAVRKAQLALEIARLETEKARAGHLPTLDAVASLNSSYLRGNSSSSLPGTTSSATVGVQLSVPLYAGHAIQNRVKETLVLEDKSSNDLEAARRGVAQATRQAFFGVQSGTAQVKALEAAESSSLLALEATQLGYKVGVRVNLDVLNAQTQLFTTRRDLAKARYDVVLGGLKLRQASGQLKAADVAAVNQLLAK
ncbi:MAG: TolC family outer membrane protein [Rhizobacter sp.]|nr:TolC family outer membrane protein [Rhizobacter sp.]